MHSFDANALIKNLSEFVKSTPELLRRTPATAAYADRLEAVDVSDATPFTMAVVGKMGAGKSTLINTLIDDHSVAKVGIGETTATINWIQYGTEEECKNFRVHWQGDPSAVETFPRGDDKRWVGDSELCSKTRYLEFFSRAEFLKNIDLIDTPGTQSVIEQHENTIQEFITAKKKCDDATMYYGGKADCLVYVLLPIAKEHDSELLEKFGRDTRISGTSAYNSIGVLSRWEAVLPTERPWEDVEKKAATMRRQLGRFVSDILVVSGPLHCASKYLGPEFWEKVLQYVDEMPDEEFDWSLENKRFLGISGSSKKCVWSVEQRNELYLAAGAAVGFVNKFPWPCFTVLLRYAKAKKFKCHKALRRSIEQLAGINRLLEVLERRFFDRAKVIRATSKLQKALAPCSEGIETLRKERAHSNTRINLARSAQIEVSPIRKEMTATRRLINQTQRIEIENLSHLETVQKSLEDRSGFVRKQFLQFDQDMNAMMLLDSHEGMFTKEEEVEIIKVLGAYGLSVSERFSPTQQPQHWDIQQLHQSHSKWLAKCEQSVGIRQEILNQVVCRFESAIDLLINAENASTAENSFKNGSE